MTMDSSSDNPSPQLYFHTLNAFQRTAALKTAIDLDLFTAVNEGNQSTGALAKRCGASERGIRILCDYLTIIGFLTKEDGTYRPTPDTQVFLDRRSPAYMGSTSRRHIEIQRQRLAADGGIHDVLVRADGLRVCDIRRNEAREGGCRHHDLPPLAPGRFRCACHWILLAQSLSG